MNKYRYSIRTLLLTAIIILNILIAAPLCYMAYNSFVAYQNAQEIRHISQILTALYNTKKNLSIERGAAISVLFVPATSFEPLNAQIRESRQQGARSFETALELLKSEKDEKIVLAVEEIKKSYLSLENIRLQLDALVIVANEDHKKSTLPDDYAEQISVIASDIDALIEQLSSPIMQYNFEVVRQMRLTRLIWEVTEYAGKEYAILGQLIARNEFPDLETKETLISLRGRIKYGLELAYRAVETNQARGKIMPFLEEAETHYMTIFEQIKDVFYQPSTVPVATLYPVTVEMWLQFASEAVGSLYEMTDSVLRVNTESVEKIEKDAKRGISLSIMLLLCGVMMSFYTWYLIITRVVNPINGMVGQIYEEARRTGEYIPASNALDEISKLEQILEALQKNTRQLQRERDKAQAASVAKSEFLANMSHEIRTPMNVVVGLSNILARSKPLTEKQGEFIRTLQVSAESLLTLINDLLDFSRIEASNLELEKIPFDFKKLIEDVVLIKSFKAKDKKLTFEADYSELKHREYIGDPTRIRQILVNICGNAIKFTEKGSVNLHVRSLPHAQDNYELIDISITDTGIGIPQDKLDSVFEKFTQADASIVRKYGGTGLGLAITKSLVDMMGGKIQVQSIDGRGTVFKVSFPLLVNAQPQFAYEDFPSQQPAQKNMGSGKVLLVEDYQPNAVVVATLLEEFGFEYDTAENGQQAVQKYMEHDYTSILMDVQMPGMDGYQATKAIRKYEAKRGGRHVRIIGLTAHASLESMQKCFEAGMDDFLAKPFNHDKLREKLEVS